MRIRRWAVALTLLALMLEPTGCASMRVPRVAAPNPLIVPSSDFETVWTETVAVLDEYFDIETENRLSGTIETQPRTGATLIEPWSGNSVGFEERLESSLQTIRRFAIARVTPAPGGGYSVSIEVNKELEDLVKPDRQTGGRAVFENEQPVNRTHDVVGPVTLPVGWIRRGRDPKLEQVILNKLRHRLFL